MSSTATSAEPAATRKFRVPLGRLQFFGRCVNCAKYTTSAVHVSGTSQREGRVLVAMLAAGIAATAAYSMTYARPGYAAAGVLSIAAELAFCYLLFYGALLLPALMLYRYAHRTWGHVAALIGSLPAAFLWLCMAVYGVSAADGDDTVQTIGLIVGLYLTALFVIHVNCRLHLYAPVCADCGKRAAAASVRVIDYFPLKRQAVLEFRSDEYARHFARRLQDADLIRTLQDQICIYREHRFIRLVRAKQVKLDEWGVNFRFEIIPASGFQPDDCRTFTASGNWESIGVDGKTIDICACMLSIEILYRPELVEKVRIAAEQGKTGDELMYFIKRLQCEVSDPSVPETNRGGPDQAAPAHV